MIIQAKFIGGDGSLGYEKHKEYFLSTKMLKDDKGKKHFGVSRSDDTGLCFYESTEAFLNNWDNIRRV